MILIVRFQRELIVKFTESTAAIAATTAAAGNALRVEELRWTLGGTLITRECARGRIT